MPVGAMRSAAQSAASMRNAASPGAFPPGINFNGPMNIKDLQGMLGGIFGANPGLFFPKQYPGELPFAKHDASLDELLKSGGMPDLQPAMDAIMKHSMSMLNETMAGTRERYGALGLGAGSDIAGAQSRDAATGIAGMNKDMQTLLVDALQKKAQMQLGANSLDQQMQQFNSNMQYGDFMRMQNPTGWMNAALGLAQPQPQGPSTGAMLGSSAITAGGSIFAAMLPFLMMGRDRNMKTEISRVDALMQDVKKLDISRWRYIGDTTKHMGRMAQDFQEIFKVGDGKTIHVVDAIGVVLQSLKEIVARLEKLEAVHAPAVC